MRFVVCITMFLVAVSGIRSNTDAQNYPMETIIHGGPIYSSPTYHSEAYCDPVPVYSSPPSYPSNVVYPPSNVVTVDPVAACCGGGSSGGDCDCKHLGSCELRLSPSNCKQSGHTHKEKIPFNPIGKIPKRTTSEYCLEKYREFDYVTKVPVIECKTEVCREIGTETIQCEVDGCKPGCSFRVCVPINECTTRTVECKLVDQQMHHVVYKRKDPRRGTVWDVYVENNPDSTSPLYAGGMPSEWLVMHCASKAQVQAKFPGMVAANKGKKVDPQSTDADVDVALVVDEKMLEELLKVENNTMEGASELESAASETESIDSEESMATSVLPEPSNNSLASDVLAVIERTRKENAKPLDTVALQSNES